MKKNKKINSYNKNTNEKLDLEKSRKKIRALEETNRFTRELLKKIAEGIIIYDSSNEIIYANPYIVNMLGMDIEDVYGENFHILFASEDRVFFKRKLDSSEEIEFEISCLHKNGTKIPAKIKSGKIEYEDERLCFLSIENLSERKKLQETIKESGRKFLKMTENSSEVLIVINEDSTIQYISNSAEKIFGFSPFELVCQPLCDYIHEDDKISFTKNLNKWIEKNIEQATIEFRLLCKDGTWIEVNTTVCNILNDPLIDGILLHVRDVTNQRKAEELAAHCQFYDMLITKLPNIGFLKTRLELEIVKANTREKQNMFAVMAIGIDKFKNINNLYGTIIGDMLLNEIARKIKGIFRGDDLVTHFSGDVFMVLLTYIARSYDFKYIINKSLEIFSKPVIIKNRKFDISVCIGISVFPVDGTNIEVLINNSQAAMYKAKESGPNNYCLFDLEMHNELINNLQLEEELKSALENNEFVVHYQPKFDRDNNIAGMESLIRWKSKKRGLIPPMDFIPLLEKNGMIVEVGYSILRMACEQIKKWYDMGFSKRVGINFAPVQFKDPELIERIEQIISGTEVNTDLLEFEITESGIMENAKEGLMKLFRIRSMGIKIAMDDFGTGLSSLSNLIAYPIDILKIDKSFVDKLPHNSDANIVVNSIINLANNLSYEVIAEGVENIEQLEYLKSLDCQMFQGFYFSKPLDAETFQKKYIQHKSK